MKFKRETAMVLNEKLIPLTIVLGEPASVVFPDEFIWKFHYAKPGYVKYFVHTHPPGMTEMSEEDRTTLKAWSYAFLPYKLHFWVVCQQEPNDVSIMEYQYKIETLEEWRKRGKEGERKTDLISRPINFLELDHLAWLFVLLELSYGKV